MFILKVVKVLYFVILLQVLILNELKGGPWKVESAMLRETGANLYVFDDNIVVTEVKQILEYRVQF